MQTIQSLAEFNEVVENNQAVLAYFSTDSCSVCHVLKPKVEQMIARDFPQIKLIYIPSDQQPEVAAQNRVFTAPTVLVFFQGKESIRKSRAFGIEELKAEIQRPYSLIFS
ncbi:MAG: thioredoxin family protein [Candidatus Saccharibacteria bacterium]